MGLFDGLGGSLISAGGALLGGLIGKESSEDAAHDAKYARLAEQAMQKEFAQNGIRWKVADAKAAGIHPLAALGANTISYSPQIVGDTGSSFNLGQGISEMGQNLGRAIDATRTAQERADADLAARQRQSVIDSQAARLNEARIDREEAEASLARMQALRIAQSQNPPMPGSLNPSGVGVVGKGGQFGDVQFQPSKIVSANPFNQSITAGPPAPMYTPYCWGGPVTGGTIELPAGSAPAEALESMGSLFTMYQYGKHNLSRWVDDNLYSPISGFKWLRPELYNVYRGFTERR